MDGIKFGPLVSPEFLRAQREPPVTGPSGTLERDKAERAAKQFESLLVEQVVRSMWATVPESEGVTKGREETLYRDMFTQAVAQDISEKQSLGIRDIVLKELSKK